MGRSILSGCFANLWEQAMEIEKRKLGKTGAEVTIMGLGGEGILRTFGYEQHAYALINRALDLGINYFESARAYSGSEVYYGLALRERRKEIFLTSKSHERDKSGAEQHLHETLTNMKTDHLDLWQVHDVRTQSDIDRIFGPNGALEAFVEAKQAGHVRFIGVTGHHDPYILGKCLTLFDFDTVLLPINPAEPTYKSFIETVVPIAEEKGMGIVGMKVYARGQVLKLPWFDSMKPFLDFALSQPISTAVIGCDSVEQLEQNVGFARSFKAMPEKEQHDLVMRIAPYATSLMYYKP